MKVRLKDIQLGQLNHECLLLVSKFARVLKADNGVQLKLQDKDVLMQVAEHARATKNSELKAVYRELKEEVRKSVYDSLKS